MILCFITKYIYVCYLTSAIIVHAGYLFVTDALNINCYY